jgi:hypothetical protein
MKKYIFITIAALIITGSIPEVFATSFTYQDVDASTGTFAAIGVNATDYTNRYLFQTYSPLTSHTVCTVESRVSKSGSPTDGLQFDLLLGGVTSTLIRSSSIVSSTQITSAGRKIFTFSPCVSLIKDNYYTFKLHRTGSEQTFDYFNGEYTNSNEVGTGVVVKYSPGNSYTYPGGDLDLKIMGDVVSSIYVSPPDNATSTADFQAFEAQYTMNAPDSYPTGTTWLISVCYGKTQATVNTCFDSGSYTPDTDLANGISRDFLSAYQPSWQHLDFKPQSSQTGLLVEKKKALDIGSTYYVKGMLGVLDVTGSNFTELIKGDAISFYVATGTVITNVQDVQTANLQPIDGYATGTVTGKGLKMGFVLDTCEPLGFDNLSAIGCYINNGIKQTMNTIFDGLNNTVTTAGTFLKQIFPLNIFSHIASDFETASHSNTTSTQSIVFASTNPKLFGGHSFTLLSSSIVAGETAKGSFDLRGLISKILYGLTGVLLVYESIKIISHIKNGSRHQVSNSNA